MKRLVRLTKIKQAEDFEYRTPEWKEYDLGKLNGNISIPIDYYVEGYLLKEPAINESIVIERINRNGEKVHGFMKTSMVREIQLVEGKTWFFKTLNSIYKMDYIM